MRADAGIASFRGHSRSAGEAGPARHARLKAYVEAILARPSFAPWIARETAFLDKTAA
jgi:hypothetical protein